MMQKIPDIGFGLWKVDRSDCADILLEAIRMGYRHFDCAADYGNEAEVGDGIQAAISRGLVSREDLWITSKLWNTYHHPDHVKMACRKSLNDLKLEYLDLYLVHFPIALEYVDFETRYPPEWLVDPDAAHPEMKKAPVPLHETWAAMENLVHEGLVKEIGVCNYSSALIHDLMAYAKIKPANLQIETHPYLTQEKLIRLARQYDIGVTAFSPLASKSYVEIEMATESDSLLDIPVIADIAAVHGKSAAQVILRWGMQRGTTIIPKSTDPQHMRENLEISDFSLREDQMAAIGALNANRRFNDPGIFCEQAFGLFHPIYD